MSRIVPYTRHARGLLGLGLPLIGSHVAQVAVGLTDAVMLGWYDVSALAAGSLGHSVWFLPFIVGSGFAFVVLPAVATAMAAGQAAQVRRVTRMGLWLSILYGAVVMPPLIWSEPLLLALGQPPGVAALTQDYLSILAFTMIPGLVIMVLKSYLAALERGQPVLWITLGMAALNVLANYVLIFGNWGFPELGVRGAAAASLLVNLGGMVAFAVYIARTTPEHNLFARFWRVDWPAFARVFRLGWPVGLTNLAESGLFSASALMMGWLGQLPLAAHGVALQLAALAFVFHLGLSQAATVQTGTALGRRNGAALRQVAVTATALSILFALSTMVLFLSVPDLLIGAFVDPDDPERAAIIAIGAGLLAIAALFALVDGMQVIALGLLRGLHDTRAPMILAAISYWGLGIPAAYVLGFRLNWDGIGVWAGLVVGLTAAAVALATRFVLLQRRVTGDWQVDRSVTASIAPRA